MASLTLLAWMFTALLRLLLVLSYTASRRGIPANHFWGIRIPTLKCSEAAWRTGHRAAILPATLAFGLRIVFGVLGLADPMAYGGTNVVFECAVIWTFIAASWAARPLG